MSELNTASNDICPYWAAEVVSRLPIIYKGTTICVVIGRMMWGNGNVSSVVYTQRKRLENRLSGGHMVIFRCRGGMNLASWKDTKR